jgi:hypothetical protein
MGTAADSRPYTIGLKAEGGFYMTEPYRQDQGTGGQYSINWGIFWSEIVHKGRGDE